MNQDLDTKLLSLYFGTEECLEEKRAGALDVAGRIAAAALLISMLDSSKQSPKTTHRAEKQIEPTIRGLEGYAGRPLLYYPPPRSGGNSYMENRLSPTGHMHPLSPRITQLGYSEAFVRDSRRELPEMSDLTEGWEMKDASARLGEASAIILGMDKEAFFFQAAKTMKNQYQANRSLGEGRFSSLRNAFSNAQDVRRAAANPVAPAGTPHVPAPPPLKATNAPIHNDPNSIDISHITNPNPVESHRHAPAPATAPAAAQSQGSTEGSWKGTAAMIGAGGLVALGLPKLTETVLDYGQKEQAPTPWGMQPYGAPRLNQNVNQYGQPMP